MILYDEIYFEITAKGANADIKKLESFIKSGELDDFFDIDSEYINHDDSYDGNEGESVLIFTNDDMGIEVDEFDTDEFLELFCKAARALDIHGSIYDIDDNEFSFTSPVGDPYYYDSSRHMLFNDELDEAAREEEVDDEADE